MAVLAVGVAGCGGGSSSTSGSSSSTTTTEALPPVAKPPPNAEEGTVFVSLGSAAGLGQVLVDSEGHTVYMYTPDEGTTSTCYGGCEAAWPPLMAEGKPTAGEGAMSSALGTTKRKDGTLQVTYAGHPLYTFSGDSAPGEAIGQENDGIWFVLGRSGEAVKGGAPSGGTTESSTTESSGAGGY